MNLFTARLTGKMLSTEQFEKHISTIQARIARWHNVDQSPLLKEYFELKAKIESQEFQMKKKELITRKYKDTDEGRKMLQYQKMNSSRRIKRYKHALINPTFQAFLAFRETENFAKIKSFKERLRSGELRMYNMINNSSYYKNYLKVLYSAELQQLNALEQEINTDDFQKRHALWADKKRWEHSKLYIYEQRYKELAKIDDIKFYLAQDKAYIDWAEQFVFTLDEQMSSNANWKPGYGYNNPVLKNEYSQAGDYQAYNGGKNTFFVNGCMEIETREETKKSAAWDAKKGFFEKVFSYTSDIMNTKAAFAQEQGLFMAKVCSKGAGNQFFGMSSGEANQMVSLYYYNGKNICQGLVAGAQSKITKLSGINRSKYYIYSLRWTKKELIWYINNMEIMRMDNTLSGKQLFLFAQSFLPSKKKAGSAKLNVQWVRVYQCPE